MFSWLQLLEQFSPRHVLTALRILPLLIATVLMAPAWALWIFLPASRQQLMIELMSKLIEWTRATRDTPAR
ncbi:hypothetical protein ACFYWN_41080 [Streptomyces sp. NPDC002917]|uniref:hypothetical protein n=1 Tax=Streptomyces sp. NPDC002917 TaxID=3364671 RepID=UPI00368ED857